MSIEDEEFLAEFDEFFRGDKFKEELMTTVVSKIEVEVESKRGNFYDHRAEIARKNESIAKMEKIHEFIKQEEEAEQKRIQLLGENEELSTFASGCNLKESASEDYFPGLRKETDSVIEKLKDEIENEKKKISCEKEELSSLKDLKFMLAVVCGDVLPTCSICFERYDKNGHLESVLSTCGHKFGRSCIEKSLLSKNNCPKCHAEFDNYKIITVFD